MSPSSRRDAPDFNAFLTALRTSLAKRRDAMSLVNEYESAAGNHTTRRRRGQFYTPEQLVNHITAEALKRHAARSKALPRILDPACGAGSLLIAAFGRVAREEHTIETRIKLLRRCIFGVDADAGAIQTARCALALSTLECMSTDEAQRWLAGRDHAAELFAVVRSQLRCGDSIFRRKPTPTGAPPVRWSDEFDMPMARGGCDVVLANPPFHSYSGRAAATLPPAARKSLRARFGEEGGWLTSHGCFLRVIAEDLAPPVAGIVLPEQVVHLAGYAPVRAALARSTGIAEVRGWGEDVFHAAVTPVVTIITDRSHEGPARLLDPAGRWVGETSTRSALAEGGIPWTPALPEMLRSKLFTNTFSLGELVRDPGVHTGNASALLIADAPSGNGRWDRVLQGRDVDRYVCRTPAACLRTDIAPTKLAYFRISPPVRYTDAAFVIRQTAAHPIVAPRRHADYFRNSLLALYPPTDGTDVRYLVGVLNSRLMRLVYRALVGESRQRTFPQVKVSSLRMLPIKRVIGAGDKARVAHDRIVALVARMLETPDDETDRAIDREVERLYGLSKKEWATLARLAGEASAT